MVVQDCARELLIARIFIFNCTLLDVGIFTILFVNITFRHFEVYFLVEYTNHDAIHHSRLEVLSEFRNASIKTNFYFFNFIATPSNA